MQSPYQNSRGGNWGPPPGFANLVQQWERNQRDTTAAAGLGQLIAGVVGGVQARKNPEVFGQDTSKGSAFLKGFAQNYAAAGGQGDNFKQLAAIGAAADKTFDALSGLPAFADQLGPKERFRTLSATQKAKEIADVITAQNLAARQEAQDRAAEGENIRNAAELARMSQTMRNAPELSRGITLQNQATAQNIAESQARAARLAQETEQAQALAEPNRQRAQAMVDQTRAQTEALTAEAKRGTEVKVERLPDGTVISMSPGYAPQVSIPKPAPAAKPTVKVSTKNPDGTVTTEQLTQEEYDVRKFERAAESAYNESKSLFKEYDNVLRKYAGRPDVLREKAAKLTRDINESGFVLLPNGKWDYNPDAAKAALRPYTVTRPRPSGQPGQSGQSSAGSVTFPNGRPVFAPATP